MSRHQVSYPLHVGLRCRWVVAAAALCWGSGSWVTWAQPDRALPPDGHLDSPRQLLEHLGFAESELGFFRDGLPLAEAEADLMPRVLDAVRRFPPLTWHRWQQPVPNWGDVLQHPQMYRGELLRFEGWVEGWERVMWPSAAAMDERGREAFRVRLRLAAAEPAPLVVDLYVPSLPRRWLTANEDRTWMERVRGAALMLKAVAQPPEQPQWIMVSRHLAWHPESEGPDWQLSVDQHLLAKYGLDLSCFDGIKDRTPLQAEDREAFYGLLDTVSRIPPPSLRSVAQPRDAMQLLQTPATERGQLSRLIGTARRAIKIEVTEADIRERWGISHYFELHMFDATARVRVRIDEGEDPGVAYGSYPIVVCTREVPPDLPLGEVIHEHIEVTGSYLKLWAYENEFLRQAAAERQVPGRPLQISPLLIGQPPIVRRDLGSAGGPPGWLVGIGFMVLFVLLCALLWYLRRDDLRHPVSARGPQRQLPKALDWPDRMDDGRDD